MYKFKDEKFEAFFDKKHVESLVKTYNEMYYIIKRSLRLSNNSNSRYDIPEYYYNNFKENYIKTKEATMFSEYFIEVAFDSRKDSLPLDDFDAKRFASEGELVPKFYILKINGVRIFVDNLDEYFEAKETTDLTDVDLAELQNTMRLSQGQEPLEGNALSTVLTGKTFNGSLGKRSELEERRLEYFKVKESIENEQHEALEELRIEKELIMAKIKKRQELMMEEMHKKELALKNKMYELEKEITILDHQMYDLKSYFGESYELIQIRKGKGAPLDQPLTINQKLRFLNEDLGVIVGLYGSDLSDDDHDSLIEAFKFSDKLVDYFCQTDKSITFFRLSRGSSFTEGFSGARKNGDNRGRNASFYIERIINERGHDFVGFVLKDGENLHFGVLDEGKRVIVNEDVFHDITAPEKEIDFDSMSDGQYADYRKKNAKERVARKFIFSILQGLIDNKRVIRFENQVNIFKMPPEIIYSSASGRIATKLYGSFESLKLKLNSMTRAGDEIYVHNLVNDANRLEQYFTYQPSIDEVFGIDKIEKILISNGKKTCFVKTKREAVGYDSGPVNCNIRIDEQEFINIQYYNSKWVEYFIANRETDNTLQGSDTSVMIRNWMGIRDFLLKREIEEVALIEKYYPDIKDVEKWQVKLSEWRLQQKSPVRSITEHQAKRFAKALIEDNIKPMEFLYEDGYEKLTDEYYLTSPRSEIQSDLNKVVENVNTYVNESVIIYNKSLEAKKKTDDTDEVVVFKLIPIDEYMESLRIQEELKNRRWSSNQKNQEDLIVTIDDVKHPKFNSVIMTKDIYDDFFNRILLMAVANVKALVKESPGEEISVFMHRYKVNAYDLDDFLDAFLGDIEVEERKISGFLVNEVRRFKKDFKYDIISNRDNIAKALNKINDALERGSYNLSDDEHIEIIKKLHNIESDLPSSNGLEDFSYAQVGKTYMSPSNDENRSKLLSKVSNPIAFSFKYKDGYYDSYLVYDKTKLELVYYHTYLRLMGTKYNDAVMAVNSFPYYRM